MFFFAWQKWKNHLFLWNEMFLNTCLKTLKKHWTFDKWKKYRQHESIVLGIKNYAVKFHCHHMISLICDTGMWRAFGTNEHLSSELINFVLRQQRTFMILSCQLISSDGNLSYWIGPVLIRMVRPRWMEKSIFLYFGRGSAEWQWERWIGGKGGR